MMGHPHMFRTCQDEEDADEDEDVWWLRDAEWWQFWMPQSGLIGGCIVGLLMWLIYGVVFGAIIRWLI
jgi:hypothetical protein